MRFSQKFNGTTPSARAPPTAEMGTARTEWREGPATGSKLEFAAGPQKRVTSMPNNRGKINDHDRRMASIVRLAAKIGTALCQSEFRHLSESEWRRLDRMRLEL